MNNIIERDGRYFVQCLDGELERTPEQLRAAFEANEVTKGYLDNWLILHDGNAWGIAQVPKDADTIVKLRMFFELVDKHFFDDLQKGKGIESAVRMCNDSISRLKADKANPYCRKNLINFQIEGWKDIKSRLQQRVAVPQQAGPVSAADTPEQPLSGHPWARIEALAERIGLRKNGAFLPASKWVPAATAGLIDALCEAEILPASGELKRLYADFSAYYGRSIKADRVNSTRVAWQGKARKALELE